MKTKLVFFAFTILTASAMRSQDTTDTRPVIFPAWIVKEIALDLNEKNRLESHLQLTTLELSTYKSLTQNLESTLSNKNLQIQLLQSLNHSLDLQNNLPKEETNAPKEIQKILSSIGLIAIGLLFGKIL